MKKKIFGITLAVALVVLSIAGTSLAYFSDTETATNTFTSGEGIMIKLTYDGTDVDDDANAGSAINISEKAYPGQKFEKKATITNIGSGEAYVGAIITITNTNKNADNEKLFPQIVTVDGDNNTVAVASLFTNLASTGYTVKAAETTDGYTVYVVKEAALDNTPATIFKEIAIPAAWGNSEMATFSGTKITVTAYAVQTVGFDGANAALKGAFNTAWENFNP